MLSTFLLFVSSLPSALPVRQNQFCAIYSELVTTIRTIQMIFSAAVDTILISIMLYVCLSVFLSSFFRFLSGFYFGFLSVSFIH